MWLWTQHTEVEVSAWLGHGCVTSEANSVTQFQWWRECSLTGRQHHWPAWIIHSEVWTRGWLDAATWKITRIERRETGLQQGGGGGVTGRSAMTWNEIRKYYTTGGCRKMCSGESNLRILKFRTRGLDKTKFYTGTHPKCPSVMKRRLTTDAHTSKLI